LLTTVLHTNQIWRFSFCFAGLALFEAGSAEAACVRCAESKVAALAGTKSLSTTVECLHGLTTSVSASFFCAVVGSR
jgi:hypothetical protein